MRKIGFDDIRMKVTRKSFKLPRLPRFRGKPQNLPPLRIGDATARLPVVQGGMAVCISLAELASAVARQGGIGVIAATAIGMLEPDYFKNGEEANRRALRREIRRARAKAEGGLLGVNIMVAVRDFHSLLRTAMEEGIDIAFLGAGLPIRNIPVAELRTAGVKVVPIVSSARAARLIFSQWHKNYDDVPDGVVVEGPLAGGHLGFKPEDLENPDFALEKLVPQVRAELDAFEKKTGRSLPVIAAGGIYDGRDIHRFLRLGAAGVQMGTRFVATPECDADDGFKQAFIDAAAGDIRIIRSPVGLPGRALDGPFLREVEAGGKKTVGCPWQCLTSCDAKKVNYCISLALYHACQGKMDRGFAFAGANAYRIEKIHSVPDLMAELKGEFISSARTWLVKLEAEYKLARESLKQMRRDYLRTFRELKFEYGRRVKEKQLYIAAEYAQLVKQIETLKQEYLLAFNSALDLVRTQVKAEV
jgi:NAD(P)H-dependent flavin oxidoreductase YrpB (nitropropane dioxygenase family)